MHDFPVVSEPPPGGGDLKNTARVAGRDDIRRQRGNVARRGAGRSSPLSLSCRPSLGSSLKAASTEAQWRDEHEPDNKRCHSSIGLDPYTQFVEFLPERAEVPNSYVRLTYIGRIYSRKGAI